MMRLPASLCLSIFALALSSGSCASAEVVPHPKLTAEVVPASAPSSLENALLEDISDHKLHRFSLLEAALIVSGARDEAELAAARGWAEKVLAKASPAADPRRPSEVGRALLERLHGKGKGAPAVFRSYDLAATSLLDVARDGSFNCVSATVLYLVAGRRLGLDVRAVLMPSHARAAVVDGDRWLVVETTSSAGFAAPPEKIREVVRRIQQQQPANAIDLYADERGVAVDDLALLGAIYTNLSVAAKEKGDLSLASTLEARADLFVEPAARPQLRRIRSSTLTSMAVRRVEEKRLEEAAELALQAAQLGLEGEDGRIARQNLVAIAGLGLDSLRQQGDEAAVLAFAGRFRGIPEASSEIEATAWAYVGELRSRRRDDDGAAAAFREGARLGAGSQLGGLLERNAAAAEINRLDELSRSDPEAAWSQWQALRVPPGEADLATNYKHLGANIAVFRGQRDSKAHRCQEVDRRAAEWAALDPTALPEVLRAGCRGDLGLARWDAGDFPGAAIAFREAMAINPKEPAFRNNLVGALERQVNSLLSAKSCSEAKALIAEGLALDSSSQFFAKAREFCAHPGSL